VPLLPPELARPFHSQAERAAARTRMERRDQMLRSIEALANQQPAAWTSLQLAAFPDTINGVADPPPQRVARWASLFAEEIAEVHRIVSTRRLLSDIELQETIYLAGRLLATVTGWSIETVDDFRVPL
jgi:hypothetical protein